MENSIPDNMKDVLNKVMNYKPDRKIPYMNEYVSDDESKEDEDANNERDLVQIDGLVQPVKPCLLNLLQTRWDESAKVNVKEVHKHVADPTQQKRDTVKFIWVQVIDMKSSTRSICICNENMTAEKSTWSSYLNKLGPND